MSILRGSSAWMLDVHGNHIKAETRQRYYSTIRQAILDLSHQVNLVQLWQDQRFDLKPMAVELEKFGVSAIKMQSIRPAAHRRAKQPCQRRDPPISNFEPHVLKMILDELLENALKFSDQAKPVECKIAWSNRQVRISVRDYGMGIPDTAKLDVFKSFYRAPNALKVDDYGLGLSIVKKLVSDYDGTISLKSKLGKGTEIVIAIPLSATETRSLNAAVVPLRNSPCPT